MISYRRNQASSLKKFKIFLLNGVFDRLPGKKAFPSSIYGRRYGFLKIIVWRKARLNFFSYHHNQEFFSQRYKCVILEICRWGFIDTVYSLRKKRLAKNGFFQIYRQVYRSQKKGLKIILWFLLVASLSHYKILNSHRQVGETKLRH
jgi:hypothetical protein